MDTTHATSPAVVLTLSNFDPTCGAGLTYDIPPRAALTQAAFQQAYQHTQNRQHAMPTVLESIAEPDCYQQCCEVSKDACSAWIKDRIPIISWLPDYDYRKFLCSDVIAGLTIGIMQIPQGMAYAVLADVPAVLGLYVSFFPVLLYLFLGTSRHISVGTFAVTSLMISKVIHKFSSWEAEHPVSLTTSIPIATAAGTFIPTSLVQDNSTAIPVGTISSVEVATVLCLAVGLVQMVMFACQLGSLSVYLSDTLVSGFTSGVAVHVFTSQVKSVLGLNIKKRQGVLKIVYTYFDVLSNITKVNLVAVLISFITIALLILINEFVNSRLRRYLKLPIPMELIVIVLGTTASFYGDFKQEYKISIVEHITTGIPKPELPPVDLLMDVMVDAIAIALVAFTVSLTLSDMFAKKHRYDIDPNQELFALGAANVISSFFCCFPSSTSLSRSLVQESSGGKTQIVSIISSLLILIILLFVAPLFETLPRCILSSIILVALKGMFHQFRDFKEFWNVSKWDAMVWLVSFSSVVILDVDIGLVIGLLVSLITVIIRCQRPEVCVLGNLPLTDLYLDINKYKTAQEIPRLKIFHFGSSIFFANKEHFRSELYKRTAINPHTLALSREKGAILHKRFQDDQARKLKKRCKENAKREKQSMRDSSHFVKEQEDSDSELDLPPLPTAAPCADNPSSTVQFIILDCSRWGFLDAGAKAILKQVVEEYSVFEIQVYFAAVPGSVLEMMERSGLLKDVCMSNVFPTIHDAVLHARSAHLSHTPSSETNI